MEFCNSREEDKRRRKKIEYRGEPGTDNGGDGEGEERRKKSNMVEELAASDGTNGEKVVFHSRVYLFSFFFSFFIFCSFFINIIPFQYYLD